MKKTVLAIISSIALAGDIFGDSNYVYICGGPLTHFDISERFISKKDVKDVENTLKFDSGYNLELGVLGNLKSSIYGIGLKAIYSEFFIKGFKSIERDYKKKHTINETEMLFSKNDATLAKPSSFAGLVVFGTANQQISRFINIGFEFGLGYGYSEVAYNQQKLKDGSFCATLKIGPSWQINQNVNLQIGYSVISIFSLYSSTVEKQDKSEFKLKSTAYFNKFFLQAAYKF